jgi:Immunoglobulin domain/Immunoglobulin I-set domain
MKSMAALKAGLSGWNLARQRATPNSLMSRSHRLGSPFRVLRHLCLLATILPCAGQAPNIVIQPQDQYACVGSNVTFYIEATGIPPMNFVWHSNGIPVFYELDQTNSFFTISSVHPSNNGDQFYVMISSPGGPTLSSNAFLYVPDPGICEQPTNTVVPPGGTIAFSVVASGTPPLTYQWFRGIVPLFNGGRIYGADAPQLFISNAVPTDIDFYHVVVSNTSSYVTSVLAHCSVGIPPTVGDVLSRIVNFGTSTIFTNSYSGTPPLFYQWYRNDVPISNATAPSLILTNVRRPEVGLYHVVVTNNAGSAASGKGHLQVRLTLEGTTPIYREEATDELPDLTNAVPTFVAPPTSVFHGVPLLFSTYNATAQSWEANACNPAPSHTMWVVYYSPRAESTRVSTEGSSFDTVVSVYTWNGHANSTPTLVACDNNSGYDGVTSKLNFSALADRDYYIAVNGVGGAFGTVRLEVGDLIRKVRFVGGKYRFELAGPYWFTIMLQSSTNAKASRQSWPMLLTMPATNQDWVISYTNANPFADGRRFYTVGINTNSSP